MIDVDVLRKLINCSKIEALKKEWENIMIKKLSMITKLSIFELTASVIQLAEIKLL